MKYQLEIMWLLETFSSYIFLYFLQKKKNANEI